MRHPGVASHRVPRHRQATGIRQRAVERIGAVEDQQRRDRRAEETLDDHVGARPVVHPSRPLHLPPPHIRASEGEGAGQGSELGRRGHHRVAVVLVVKRHACAGWDRGRARAWVGGSAHEKRHAERRSSTRERKRHAERRSSTRERARRREKGRDAPNRLVGNVAADASSFAAAGPDCSAAEAGSLSTRSLPAPAADRHAHSAVRKRDSRFISAPPVRDCIEWPPSP